MIAEPGGPRFGSEKEGKDARATYPALRKKLGLPDGFAFPDGKNASPPPK